MFQKKTVKYWRKLSAWFHLFLVRISELDFLIIIATSRSLSSSSVMSPLLREYEERSSFLHLSHSKWCWYEYSSAKRNVPPNLEGVLFQWENGNANSRAANARFQPATMPMICCRYQNQKPGLRSREISLFLVRLYHYYHYYCYYYYFYYYYCYLSLHLKQQVAERAALEARNRIACTEYVDGRP